MRAARAVADLSRGSIHALVEIAAPPERVFRALASEEILKWWGSPDTYRCTKWTGEVKVGGKWRTEGIGSDGKPFWVEGEYLEIDAPKKLVQTWRYGWDTTGTPTVITYRLDPISGGTRVTLKHTGFEKNPDACLDHGDGWERVLGWLSKHFA